jgi:hypothetical protein
VTSETSGGLRKGGIWLLSDAKAVELLIQQLNARTGREGEALRELVRDFNQIDEMARTRGVPNFRSVFEEFSLHPENQLRQQGFDEASVRRMRKIQAAFRSYRLIPLPAYRQKDGCWKFHWVQPWGTKPNDRRLVQWMFLAVILDLATIGQLRRVRECAHDGRWFFARRDDRRFCPDRDCKEKHWRSSDEGKAKRAGYMRGYRRRLDRMNRALKAENDRGQKGSHSPRK